MTIEEFIERLGDIFDKIHPVTYKETYDILDDLLVGEGYVEDEEDMFKYACDLQGADATKPIYPKMYDFLIDFYTSINEEDHKGDAYLNLGVLYYDARYSHQDYAKAVEYYKKASDLGSVQATENLGYCYYYGRAGEKNYELAFKCFLKAAIRGSISSAYKLSDMYKYGYYVDRDYYVALDILNMCMDKIDRESIEAADIYIRIADFAYNGYAMDKDLDVALAFYNQAERAYYIRVNNGDYMYKEQLRRAIEMQDAIRKEIMDKMPKFEFYKGE